MVTGTTRSGHLLDRLNRASASPERAKAATAAAGSANAVAAESVLNGLLGEDFEQCRPVLPDDLGDIADIPRTFDD